jgi:hypothetical protein
MQDPVAADGQDVLVFITQVSLRGMSRSVL